MIPRDKVVTVGLGINAPTPLVLWLRTMGKIEEKIEKLINFNAKKSKFMQNPSEKNKPMIFKTLHRWLFTVALMAIAGLFALGSPALAATNNPPEFARVVQVIDELDAMRSGLASTIEPGAEITPQTMKEVCKPVGMKAKQLSQEEGWQVKQVAKKYRNPDHAPQTLQETMAIAQFENNPNLVSFAETKEDGLHYYRRITVDGSCLACHGAKADRPAFVKAKYLEDLAYDFQAGDLRGIYSVVIPTLQELDHQ